MNKKILIPLAIAVLIIGGIGIKTYQTFSQVTNVDISKKDSDLSIKDQEVKNPNITNIALFGINKSDSGLKGRSDSIMIASLDTKSKAMKVTSIAKDTYIEIPEKGMDKISNAYALGGPELALKTINQNFDMDIRDFISVDFEGLINIVDSLGGVEVDVKKDEVQHIKGSTEGTQLLNGNQVIAYSAIKKADDEDFERRQRQVLENVLQKVLDAGMANNTKLLSTILPYMETSLTQSNIIKLGTSMIGSNKKNVEQFKIPTKELSNDKTIDEEYYVEPNTLESNKELLHKFIYQD